MVFIPLSDDNPLRSIRFQWMTVSLIVVNVLVFVWQSAGMGEAVAASFALIPSELVQVKIFGGAAHGPMDALAVPEGYTLITYMFLHANIIHLASNMLFLWVFGDNVEDALGHVRYVAFYVTCGIVAGLVHTYMLPTSKLPLIGAYLMLHPRVMVWVLAFRFIPLKISAAWVLGVWVATQVTMVLIKQSDEVAWWAHIGGVVTGALLILVLRRPGVPLFDRRR